MGDSGRIRALAAAEIAAATQVPEVTAGFLIDHSDLLTRDFPTTPAALEEGSLSKRHAWAVVEEAISIPDTVPAVLCAFESALITMAAKTTVRIFHRVDTAARTLQGPDEPRTLTQLRADVLEDVLTSAGPIGHMTDSHSTRGSDPVKDVGSGPGFRRTGMHHRVRRIGMGQRVRRRRGYRRPDTG